MKNGLKTHYKNPKIEIILEKIENPINEKKSAHTGITLLTVRLYRPTVRVLSNSVSIIIVQ